MALTDILMHPLTAIATVGSALLAVVPAGAPVWEFIGATAGTWFPLLAVSAGTILPNVGYADLGTTLLVGAGIVYVAVYADRFIERTQEYLDK